MTGSKIRVAFLIPSGIGLGYTGPGIFLKRLIKGSSDSIDPQIYAGLRKGHQHDPNFFPKRSMNFSKVGAWEQLKWALLSTYWIIRDRNDFDVVHFHGTFIYKIVGTIACILVGKPFVLVPLSSDADMSENGKLSGNFIIKPIRRAIVKRAAHGFALGNSVAEELISAGLPDSRVTLIHNPVSPNYFGPGNPNRFDNRKIVFIGIVGNRKRALLVLESVRELRHRGIEATCSFYGPYENSDFEKEFQENVARLELNSVITHIDYSDQIHEVLLNDASLFLLPSKQEGIPGALVESLAAGVPCVVTDAGSMAQVITEADAGNVVSPSVKKIADYCEGLLTDRQLWTSISEKSRAYATDNLSSASVGQSYAEIIRKISK